MISPKKMLSYSLCTANDFLIHSEKEYVKRGHLPSGSRRCPDRRPSMVKKTAVGIHSLVYKNYSSTLNISSIYIASF